MRLLIISALEHYQVDGKVLAGWAPVAREFDYLASVFLSVRHVAPLHPGPPPAHAEAYQADIEFSSLSPAGGPRLGDKVRLLAKFPLYVRALLAELRRADAVYVRCPSSIALLALLLLIAKRQPRVRLMKYAGDWTPVAGDRWSYRLQRWLLRYGSHGGQVSVNSADVDSCGHVHRFVNPSFTVEEWRSANQQTLSKTLSSPLRLLFVGRLDERKGGLRAVRACLALCERGWDVRLDIVGEGPEGDPIDALVSQRSARRLIARHGWMSTTDLANLYQRAHFLVLPSATEGWPKVVSEAMAYRAVPVVGAVSCLPEVLSNADAGVSVPFDEPDAFADAIETLVLNEARWRQLADNGQTAAAQFTYERHVERIRALLQLPSLQHSSQTAAA